MRFEKLFNHDIKQLLHVYPLDAKTKDGNLFWSLPKRPPVPVDFDKENMLSSEAKPVVRCQERKETTATTRSIRDVF